PEELRVVEKIADVVLQATQPARSGVESIEVRGRNHEPVVRDQMLSLVQERKALRVGGRDSGLRNGLVEGLRAQVREVEEAAAGEELRKPLEWIARLRSLIAGRKVRRRL